MGQRGEVFSTRLHTGDRTYFFNVKENYRGDMYLNLVESKVSEETGRFIRQSIIVYPEDLGEFLREMQQAVDYVKINAEKQSKVHDDGYHDRYSRDFKNHSMGGERDNNPGVFREESGETLKSKSQMGDEFKSGPSEGDRVSEEF